MKKYGKLLIALLIAVAAPAFVMAQSKIMVADKLTWKRGISSYGLGVDSTRISIPTPAGDTNDHTDTTAWFDVGEYKFSQTFAKQPMVLFQINGQLSTTTDSVGFILQYTNDKGANGSAKLSTSSASLVSVTASTAGVTAGDDGMYGTVVAVSADAATGQAAGTSAALPFRFARLIVNNQDVSGATGRRYFSVTPIVYGWK